MARDAVSAPQSEAAFEFGKNWRRFLGVLTPQRIAEAERSLAEMLGVPDLRGRSFLDAGCGSGLFSLAARNLGAARVHSFDVDAESVSCARELKRRFHPDHPGWTIEQGSVLDASYVTSLGKFDIVYSWGVLHHTGDMWQGLGNVAGAVAHDGRLFIALYNDQGWWSRYWRTVKRTYVRAPAPVKIGLVFGVGLYWELRGAMIRAIRLQNPLPFDTWRKNNSARGMSVWHDLVDWVGGYPFEVAKPEEVFDFCRERGFRLARLSTCGGGHACNQFVFARTDT